ncbi:hypothetical protein ALQ74_102770, partial [Pseudomonas savastanoi pv. glycinea]
KFLTVSPKDIKVHRAEVYKRIANKLSQQATTLLQ